LEAALSELKRKLRSIWPHLDERTRRLTAANEAMSLGYGGVSLVHRACGLSRKAILKGMREIRTHEALVPGRIRRPGAGRNGITISDPELLDLLDELIEGHTRGDPESPLRWICKSTRVIARSLSARRHPVSHVKWRSCCMNRTVACRAIARRRKARIIPTGIRSSGTSALRSGNVCARACR